MTISGEDVPALSSQRPPVELILFLASSSSRHLLLDTLSFFFSSSTRSEEDVSHPIILRLRLVDAFLDALSSSSVDGSSLSQVESRLKSISPTEKRKLLQFLERHGFCVLHGEQLHAVNLRLLLYLDACKMFFHDFLLLLIRSSLEDDSVGNKNEIEALREQAFSTVAQLGLGGIRAWRKILAQMAFIVKKWDVGGRDETIDDDFSMKEQEKVEAGGKDEHVKKHLVESRTQTGGVSKEKTVLSITRTSALREWQDIKDQLIEALKSRYRGIVHQPSSTSEPHLAQRDFFHPFLERIGCITIPKVCFCTKEHARSKCYHVIKSRASEVIGTFVKHVIVFEMLNLLMRTNSFIPRFFWKKITRYGVDMFFYDRQALRRAYLNSFRSTHWLIIILPKTLVGDDDESEAALQSLLGKPDAFLTSLVYRIPITDKRDDAIIRAINRAGGELHVLLMPNIIYPPLAISDNQKLFFTSLSDAEDIFPLIYAETTNVNFINEVISEFIDMFNRFPAYEDVYPHLEALYQWYHDPSRHQLPEITVSYLQQHGILDENGRLSELGEIIVKGRLY